MKKEKRRFREALLEALGELVLTLVFFGIGALVLNLFGIDISFAEADPDLIALLGILAAVACFGLVYLAVSLIKKRKREVSEENCENNAEVTENTDLRDETAGEEEKMKHRCRTYFLIEGNFDARALLKRMGISNAEATNKGDPYGPFDKPSEISRLQIGYNDDYRVDTNEMIRESIRELLPFASGLAALKDELELEYYLAVVPEIYRDSPEPTPILSLDGDIIEFLRLTNTKHDLDYYIY